MFGFYNFGVFTIYLVSTIGSQFVIDGYMFSSCLEYACMVADSIKNWCCGLYVCFKYVCGWSLINWIYGSSNNNDYNNEHFLYWGLDSADYRSGRSVSSKVATEPCSKVGLCNLIKSKKSNQIVLWGFTILIIFLKVCFKSNHPCQFFLF